MSNFYETIDSCCENLKLDFGSGEFAKIATDKNYSEDSMQVLAQVLDYLSEKKTAATIRDIVNKSRLPKANLKTFESFNFTLVKGRDVERLRTLNSLATLYAHTNIAFVGPPGTGKTHLAQAYGYECCKKGIKVFFIKASELRDRFNRARKAGSTANCVNKLVRFPCLIIDEIGHCEFDKENTRLFFDLIDRRYNKEGITNTVFTSNKNPSDWVEYFSEEDALLCALDRIFDDATVF